MAGSQGKVHKVAARHVHTHSSGAAWRRREGMAPRQLALGCLTVGWSNEQLRQQPIVQLLCCSRIFCLPCAAGRAALRWLTHCRPPACLQRAMR